MKAYGSVRVIGLLSLLVAMLAPAIGCSPYRLEGAVVAGVRPSIQVTDADDPRLSTPGISDASVEVVIDPRSLGNRRVPPVVTGPEGRFSLPIDEVGAGFLEYEAEVLVEAAGYMPVIQRLMLPGSDKRLLVVMTPGTSRGPARPRDVLEESLEFRKQMMGDQ